MRTMCCNTLPSIIKNGRETRHLCGNSECTYYMKDVNLWIWDDKPTQQKEIKMSCQEEINALEALVPEALANGWSWDYTTSTTLVPPFNDVRRNWVARWIPLTDETRVPHWLIDAPTKGWFIPNITGRMEMLEMSKISNNPSKQQIIQNALDGKRGEDQQRIAQAGLDFIDTLLRKNNDYGSSVWKKPLLAPNTDVAAAILVRMTDKVERLISLQSKAAEVISESFDDTMKDLGAYALLYLARPKNEQLVPKNEQSKS